MAAIALVGMACRYPDADSPETLWENVLAQRRAFRRLPVERLSLEEYHASERSTPDSTYSSQAALIEGYEFDRVRFRVAGSMYRSADLVHWLALDIASRALADAGFPEGEGLPRATTGVVFGNTLTGEFSRANVMRLRWPYVRRVLEAALVEKGWKADQCREFLGDLEGKYKAPFPPIGEETLAGALSNTIAGRVCNYFDFKGGGYTVDGACAASLLAVATACSALVAGDLDAALAGGVDLSLDPFELVGFAKVGALAEEEMWVYDAHSAGFWPGEGCGVVVLMRHEDAVRQSRRIYAIIRGWGISSDGSGGITRPEVEGQLLAAQRAYRRAGFGIQTVGYFEGHGTGTSVGDAIELQMLTRARREAAAQTPPAVIGSIKANIGHTKAAAGIAGLLKATMALYKQILPPTTGCEKPHPELSGENPALRVLSEGELWPANRPLHAAVGAMGFGGINTHFVLEGKTGERRQRLSPQERSLLSSNQDTELILMDAADSEELGRQVDHLSMFADRLSRAEVTDLAARQQQTLHGGPVRAAVVASNPDELASHLGTLKAWLANGIARRIDLPAGVFLGGTGMPRVGFLFPGQGSPAHLSGGAWRRRFDFVRELYERMDLPQTGDGTATVVAQPAIVTASLAGLRTLEHLRVTASLAIGHSLGELTALHWAGAVDEAAVLRIARARGKAMGELPSPTGAMASIGTGQREVEGLMNGEAIVLAGLNSPCQTVISGETVAVASVVARARTRGLRAVILPVSHAFHSQLMATATPALREHLRREDFRPWQRQIYSTVTGSLLATDEDLRELLIRQVTSPVRFLEAAMTALPRVDFLIEVGPGQVLSGLISDLSEIPVVSLDAGGPSVKGLLQAVGAAFVLGVPINHRALFAGRFTRPFDLNWQPRFFVNPCELAPRPEGQGSGRSRRVTAVAPPHHCGTASSEAKPLMMAAPLEVVRQLVAQRAELPPSAVKDDNRLLGDLHLTSIAVGQLVTEASRRLGLSPPVAPTDYADATVIELARALEERAHTGGSSSVEKERMPAGVDSWIRTFAVELVERRLPRRPSPQGTGSWQIISAPDHPLRVPLQQAFIDLGGGGVVVCLPPIVEESHIGLLLQGARAILAQRGERSFVLVQHSGGGAAFARTLHLEADQLTTCVVDVPPQHPRAAEWVAAEAQVAVGYSEAHYDASGIRREPVLHLLPLPENSGKLPLGPQDVLLVSGGGKGIAAESALVLARATGAQVALLGRSQPDADAELAANLDRMAAAGIRFRYLSADVRDEAAVRAAVVEIEATLGPVTAILHGAGTNVPCLLRSLDETAFRNTLAAKVQGARHLLAAVQPDRLRLLIAFGSVIARIGMPGEADYAVANDWLARLTERWQTDHPHCRCLAVEWSVWSGVGMGQRLGRVDALMQQGVTPIPPDEGVRLLSQFLSHHLPMVSVVVTGRFGEPPTLKMERLDLPLRRFLERPLVYYPGVELVTEADLSADADPYLADHVFRRNQLFPAVMGLEAMAQVAMALAETDVSPTFRNVKFVRPIPVPQGGPLTLRIAALVRGTGRIEVVLRSAETAFAVDHFRAVCLFGNREADTTEAAFRFPSAEIPVALNPDKDLYGDLLFQEGRFRRLHGYRRLMATECSAEIVSSHPASWFGRYLPGRLLLGDPGVRDAAIHAIQPCIPHAAVLPIGIEQVLFCRGGSVSSPVGDVQSSGPVWVCARERLREGNDFIYDLEVTGSDGRLLEQWRGLQLHIVEHVPRHGAWPAPLLGPYLERRLGELLPGAKVAVVVEQGTEAERQTISNRAIQRVLGTKQAIRRRSDGKPEIQGVEEVSVAHAGPLTLAVASSRPLGCDSELVRVRPVSAWRDLLGTQRQLLAGVVAREAREDEATASTRVWAATECLKKAEFMLDMPLVLRSVTADRWVLLAAGELTVATIAAPVRGVCELVVLAVLARSHETSL